MATDWMVVGDVEARYDGTFTPEQSARANTFLGDALARMKTVAACYLDPSTLPEHVQDAAKGIIAAAVIRRLDDVKGGTQFQSAGMFSMSTDTKLRSDRILSIADRDELKQLCRTARRRRRGGSIRTRIGY